MNDWKATAMKLGGVGRSTVFELWKSGELKSCCIGRRRFSTDNQIAEYVARLEGAA
ncbi:MAG: hypothetical protein U0Q20_07870 [Mycobacterium sp.]|nr:hypothetical protein [Mycobacterium sp.]